MKKPTLKQQKTINKVREVMQDYPTGIPFNELMQKCLLSAVATQLALGALGASESFDGLWRLPHRNSSVEQPVMQESAESLQETAEMMQESDQQSSTSQAIETAPVAESSEIDEQNTKVGQAINQQFANGQQVPPAYQNNPQFAPQNPNQQQPNFNNNMQGEPQPSTVDSDIPFNALNGQLAHLI